MIKKKTYIGILLFFLFGLQSLMLYSQWMKTGLSTNATINNLVIAGSRIYCCASDGLYFSDNNGLNWQPAGLANKGVTSAVAVDTLLIAGTFNDGLWRSSDTGKTWLEINNGIVNYKITALALAGNTLYAGTYFGGLYRSLNSGSSWSVITDPAVLTGKWIEALNIFGNTIYALTNNGGVMSLCFNGCGSSIWSIQNTSLPSPVENLMCFGLANLYNRLFLGTSKGVFQSVLTPSIIWNYSYFENFYVKAMASADTFVIAGTNTGIYLSCDTGKTWTYEQDGMPACEVTALLVNGNYVLCGTKQNGLYIRTLDNLTRMPGHSTDDDFPFTVYPNPFSSEFTIGLKKRADINQPIIIYDARGMVVFSSGMAQSCCQYHVNGNRWPDGIYVVQFTLNGVIYRTRIIKIN